MIRIYNDEITEDTYITKSDNTYIVQEDNKIIGYFNLTFLDNKVILDYELVKSLRNNHLGSHLLNVIEDYITDSYDVDEIILLIKFDNEKSMKIAKKNNYIIDYIFLENMDGEMNSFKPYVKIFKK